MDISSTSPGKTPVQIPCNTTPKHFRWTYEMESHFLELFLKEDRIGNRVGGTFSSSAYRSILCELQNTFGTCLRKNHLRNKIRTLKANYSEFKDAFKGMSGFSWNWNSKKFDAEDEVWEALIKEKPDAATLRHKTCIHWDIMNELWASSRAVGIESSTARERFSCAQQQIHNEGTEVPSTNRNNTYSSEAGFPSGSEGPRNETMGTPQPVGTNSQSVDGLDQGKRKRKANVEGILASCTQNISSSLREVSRAIVESAEILAKKLGPSTDRSKELFNALLALDLPKEYLIQCYQYLNKHEADANMFLGMPDDFRMDMLTRIMGL